MNSRIEIAAGAYIAARKAHAGQKAAYKRLASEVHAALAERFPKLPHVDPRKPLRQRLSDAWRRICGEVA